MKDYNKSALRRHKQTEKLRQRRQAMRRSPAPPRPTHGDDDLSNPLDLIRREIAIMKKLDHPNVVTLIEVLNDAYGDSLHMIFEYCSKGAIMNSDTMWTGSRPIYNEEQCRLFFRDMILGIEYLHSQGIIHRDIKADNILLDEDDVVKIADFGVSEILDPDNDIITKTAGSPAYMAPELAALSSHVELKMNAVDKGINISALSGKSTDIWSMGVTLYFLVFGRLPFRSDNMVDLYDKIVNEDLYIPENCNLDLKDLLCRIMTKLPQHRITMDELRNHPWVTRNGEDKLLSKEENTADNIAPITEEDLSCAIELVQGLMEPAEAIAKLRKLHGWRDYANNDQSRTASLSPRVRATEARSPSPMDETMSLYKLTRALEEVVNKSGKSPQAKSTSPSTQSGGSATSSNDSSSSIESIPVLQPTTIFQSMTGEVQTEPEPAMVQPQPTVTHDPMMASPMVITPNASITNFQGVAASSSGIPSSRPVEAALTQPSQRQCPPPAQPALQRHASLSKPVVNVARKPSRTHARRLAGQDTGQQGPRSKSLDPPETRR